MSEAPVTERDTLYAEGIDSPGSFVFDERVVRVFPDMIARSVPGYGLTVPMTGLLARRYAQDGSKLYDLGCSRGATTLAMRGALGRRDLHILAVDSSAAMVHACREQIAAAGDGVPVEVVEADVRDCMIEDASVVVMNYTLQFVEPADRLALLTRVCTGLRPGGVLILSEKIRFQETASQDLQTTWHEDYKRAKGYSELEISGKRTALENVLQADTEEQHRARLREAGFSRVERWFQCFSFCGFIAFR